MRKYRDSYIEDELVLADSGSKTINIPFQDIASQLELRFQATNGGTRNLNNDLIHCLSKLELVDGSDVLFGLTGPEIQGLNFINRGKVPWRFLSETADDMNREVLYMDFGRYLGDPLWAFNPNKFKNPQLKLTWNLAAVNTVGAEGFLSGTGRMTIIAKLFDEPVSPVGFLMSKEHYSFTSAGSGIEPADMPVDHPYRTLFIRAFERGTFPGNILTKFKLTEENDKRIPFDIHEKDHRSDIQSKFNMAEYTKEIQTYHDQTLYFDVYEAHVARILNFSNTARMIAAGAGWGGQCQCYPFDHDGTVIASYEKYFATYRGWYFHALIPFLFGDPQNPEDWYDPTTVKDLKLKLTQGNADAACVVCLQQARKY